MAASTKNKKAEKWLKDLGKKINHMILNKGYRSPYEFWIEKIGEDISRSGLNFILAGKRDPKITTLKMIGDALGVRVDDMLP